MDFRSGESEAEVMRNAKVVDQTVAAQVGDREGEARRRRRSSRRSEIAANRNGGEQENKIYRTAERR